MDIETRQLLKSALVACSRETRTRLAPLLHIDAVQQLLTAFLADTSRPFEDWILDAHTQSLLAQLAELASSTDVEKSGLNDLLAEEFDAAATRRSVLESSSAEARRPLVVMEVQRIRDDAKIHFREGQYHIAKKLYETALALCIPSENEDWAQGLAATIAGLHVNLAICNSKMGDWPGVLEACSSALKFDPTNVKALYWRAKYHISNSAYDVAIDDLEAVMVDDETNREAQALLEECRRKAHDQQANRVLAHVEKAANIAQWQARKSGAQLPKSKKEFLEEARSQLQTNTEADQLLKSLGPGMPRPPALNHKSRSPSQLLQQYISCCAQHKVEIWDEPCKLSDGRRGFKCSIKQVGVAAATGEDTSKKKAKQRAALAFLQALYPVYMERNPTDRPFQPEEMEPTPEMMASIFANPRSQSQDGEEKMAVAEGDAENADQPATTTTAMMAASSHERGRSKRQRASDGGHVLVADGTGAHSTEQPTASEDSLAQATEQPPMDMEGGGVVASKRKERSSRKPDAQPQGDTRDGQQRRPHHKSRANATPDFHEYTRAWFAALLEGRYERLVFPAGLRGNERQYIMEYIYYHPEGRGFSVNVARYMAPGKQVTKLKSVVVSRVGYLPRPGVLDSMDVPPPPYMPEGHAQQLVDAKATLPRVTAPRKWVQSAEALAQTDAAPRLSPKEVEAFQGYLDSWTAVLALQQVKGVKFPKTLSAKHRAHLLRWSRTHSFLRGIVEARLTEGYEEPDLSTVRLVIEVKEAPSELGYISAPAW